MSDDNRKTVTELRLDNLEGGFKDYMYKFEKHMTGEDDRWDEINERLMKLEKFVDKFTGFVGGVTIVLASVVSVIAWGISAFSDWLAK